MKYLERKAKQQLGAVTFDIFRLVES